MITYYTCTQVTPEVYAAYLKYRPRANYVPFDIQELQAVALCTNCEGITIFPVRYTLNMRHLRAFGSTDLQSNKGDINILVSVEEFFNQLFILELEQ